MKSIVEKKDIYEKMKDAQAEMWPVNAKTNPSILITQGEKMRKLMEWAYIISAISISTVKPKVEDDHQSLILAKKTKGC